jgi:hypothetical protein
MSADGTDRSPGRDHKQELIDEVRRKRRQLDAVNGEITALEIGDRNLGARMADKLY